MNIEKFISKYSWHNASSIDYSEIIDDIHGVIFQRPFPIVSLYKNEIIERIRNNYNGEVFYEKKEVSLRRDLNNILDFGRVNKPHQSNFYGTLADDDIDLARITTVLETNETLRKRSKRVTYQQIFTTGQWVVEGDLRLIIIPFHEQVTNTRLRRIASNFRYTISQDFRNEQDEIFKLLCFFSDLFGKKITHAIDYKLTAAFGEVFMQDYHMDGILYPSTKSEYRTQNIVLNEVGLRKLKLSRLEMTEFFIHDDQVFLDLMAYVETPEQQSKFNWINVERTPLSIINQKLGK